MEEVSLIKDCKLKRDDLKRLGKAFLSNPALKLLAGEEGTYPYREFQLSTAKPPHDVKKVLDDVKKWSLWLSEEKNVRDLIKLLLKDKLFKKPFHTEKSVIKTIDGLKSRLANFPKNVFTKSFPFSKSFLSEVLIDSMESIPFHPFLEFCTSIDNKSKNQILVNDWLKTEKAEMKDVNKVLTEIEGNILAQEIKEEFLSYFPEVFTAKKQQLNVMTYDDLLLNLQSALEGDDGDRFVNLVSDRFKVAMIDEFQDTDPVQYKIFSTFFGTDSTFFMIGDPKQSIYKFRGADITSYLEAKASVTDPKNIHTLDTNYRSEKAMVDAANLFFEPQSDFDAFVSEKIKYERVSAGPEKPALLKDGAPTPALQMHWLDSKSVVNSGLAVHKTVMAVCDEIVELTAGSYTFNEDGQETRVQPGDIAVLVTAHKQSRKIQQELSKRGIPAVLQSSGNIFDSDEAQVLVRVLKGIISLSDYDLRPALISNLFGLNAGHLLAMNDKQYMAWYTCFMACQKRWVERGFMAMFSYLSQLKLVSVDGTIIPTSENSGEGLRARLVKKMGGERILTNLLHLSEILHEVEQQECLTPEGVLSWFVRKFEDEDKDSEAYLQRLESDSAAVKLLTVHASKGLEFPITFCPFMWSKKFKNRMNTVKKDFTFHKDGENCYEIGSTEVIENFESFKEEELQELMRLLYVAITRSRNRCYLHWGAFNESESSALMYWMEKQFPEFDLKNYISEGKGSLKFSSNKDNPAAFMKSADAIIDKFGDLISGDTPAMELTEIGEPTGAMASLLNVTDATEALTPKIFSGQVKSGWAVSSFSGLTKFASHGHGKPSVEVVKDVDAQDEPTEPVKKREGIAAFIDLRGGATLGTAVHEIFEEVDFTKLDQEEDLGRDVEHLVEQRLKRYSLIYGRDTNSREQDLMVKKKVITQMVRDTVSRTIGLGENGVVRLDSISTSERLVEMNFFFRLKSISNGKLQTIFERPNSGEMANAFAEKLGKLNFDITKGYMNGAIDLTFQHQGKFYILDWKTTSCGKLLSDYTDEALVESMMDHHYILQYHIYAAALHLYLKKRVPNYSYASHFGGAIYAYVRGVNENNNNGFFYDCPPEALIESICKELIGEEK